MAIQWGKKRELQITTDYVREHLCDGKVIDQYEYIDREILCQQLRLFLSFPEKKW